MDIDSVEAIPDLNRWLAERHLQGFWERDPLERTEFKPFLWKWEDIYAGLMKATEVVRMDQTGIQTGRRNISLRNPSLGNRGNPTIVLGIQCIMPGEAALAHRHTPAAIRFVVKGTPGAYTVVEGEPIPMEDGDLITTPTWTWHDHYNEGNEPVIWLDGLDAQLVRIAETFRADFPGPQQPRDKPVGWSSKTLGHARPLWMKSEHSTPPLRYPWTDTYATLAALRESETPPDPYDGYHLMYTHPLNGGPTLPTFACNLQLFTPKLKTRAHRHNSTTIYQAFRGKGVTIVDGERLEWSQGDMFVVPPWKRHEHENLLDGDSILFSICDWPAIQALGLYKEEGS